MEDSEKEKIFQEFLEQSGNDLPNPEHYPKIFATMFRHFMYNRSKQTDTKEAS